MDKVGDEPTRKEVKREEEKYKGIFLLKRSVILRDEPLIKGL